MFVPVAELQQVREVGRPVRELEHRQIGGDAEARREVLGEARPVELLARTHGGDLRRCLELPRVPRRHRVRTVQALMPGAP